MSCAYVHSMGKCRVISFAALRWHGHLSPKKNETERKKGGQSYTLLKVTRCLPMSAGWCSHHVSSVVLFVMVHRNQNLFRWGAEGQPWQVDMGAVAEAVGRQGGASHACAAVAAVSDHHQLILIALCKLAGVPTSFVPPRSASLLGGGLIAFDEELRRRATLQSDRKEFRTMRQRNVHLPSNDAHALQTYS